jgi:hypothetical protein
VAVGVLAFGFLLFAWGGTVFLLGLLFWSHWARWTAHGLVEIKYQLWLGGDLLIDINALRLMDYWLENKWVIERFILLLNKFYL